MENINQTQQRILQYLIERFQTTNVPPSIREIGSAVGLKSTSSVQSNLDALEQAGYIYRDPKLKRSIHLTMETETPSFTRVPLVGTVTAGKPILAVEEIEGYLPFNGTVTSDKPVFALRVHENL